MRRDYLTATAYHFNVNAETDIEPKPPDQHAPLTLNKRRDLPRHRRRVRTPEHPTHTTPGQTNGAWTSPTPAAGPKRGAAPARNTNTWRDQHGRITGACSRPPTCERHR